MAEHGAGHSHLDDGVGPKAKGCRAGHSPSSPNNHWMQKWGWAVWAILKCAERGLCPGILEQQVVSIFPWVPQEKFKKPVPGVGLGFLP